MLDRKSLIIRVIAGGALLYIGGDLFLSVLRERPEHYIVYGTAGAIFAVLGLIWAGMAVKKLATHDYKELLDDDAEDMEELLENKEDDKGES